MNESNTIKLLNEYPEFFSDAGQNDISCGDGWFKIIHVTLALIKFHVENPAWILDAETNKYKKPPEAPQCKILQIKEKFGALRIYISNTTPYSNGVIAMAEQMSYSICEDCGTNSSVTTNHNGWSRTLCEKCRTGSVIPQTT